MPKNAISVTLDADNLAWLKARAGSGEARSVSDLLDRIVSEARERRFGTTVKSVVGTIDVDPSDPMLLKADEAIHALFAESLGRPFVVKETRASYGTRGRKRRG
jgi:hypothetical protein